MVFRGVWQPQYVQYNLGDVVEFEGQHYEIIQPHHSQADWPPTATPALWKHVDGSQHQGQEPENHPPVYQPQEPKPNYNGFAPKPEGGYTTANGQEVPHEETKKPWYDIRGDKKAELVAAGGLAVGLGLLGGGLYYHEKHGKESKEEREAQAWELQNWVLNAKNNSDAFIREGPKGPVTWILNDTISEHPDLMRNLVHAGEEKGEPWYIARSPYHGSLQLGKCQFQPGNPSYGYIGYDGEAIKIKKFEVLISAPNSTIWVRSRGQFNPNEVQASPIKGGHESDGSVLFIAHIRYKDAVHPGKCGEKVKGGSFCYGDKEKSEEEYEVLCYKQ